MANLAKVEGFWVLVDNLLMEHLPARVMKIIGDDHAFQARIDKATVYLRDEAPRWYQYVTQHENRIGPCGPCPYRRSIAYPELNIV